MISRTFKSDYTFSETDSYTIIIVQYPELKCDATQVEIDDTRYLSCLSVVPLVMDATNRYLKLRLKYPAKYLFFSDQSRIHVISKFNGVIFILGSPWENGCSNKVWGLC